MSIEFYFLIVILAIIAVVFLAILGRFISLWFQAFVSGTPIPIFTIIGMSLRKIPPRVIVIARITLYKAGLKQISVADLETHFLAGGNIENVVGAMIAADKANIELEWRQATAIDLAGRDVKGAVQTSVYPTSDRLPKRRRIYHRCCARRDSDQSSGTGDGEDQYQAACRRGDGRDHHCPGWGRDCQRDRRVRHSPAGARGA